MPERVYIIKIKLKKRMSKRSRIEKVVLLPDIHYPEHSKQSMSSIMNFIEDFIPDEIVYQGDQLDLSMISEWNKNNLTARETRRLCKEYDGFNNEILLPIEKLIKKDCRKTFLIGNHEHRVKRYIDEHPELEGLIEPEFYLDLEKRGYKIVENNAIHKLGKLNVIHGYYWQGNHASKTVLAFEENVVYCHTHGSQEFTKTTPVDTKQSHSATGLPCLCDLNPSYAKNKPNSWVHGFGVVYVKPSGEFNLYPIKIINNSFIFNGYLYEPAKKTKV